MAKLSVLSSMATRGVLADLAAAFENQHGIEAAVTSVGGVDAARRLRAGEAFDVVVLASPVMTQLEAEGHVLAGSRRDFARSDISVAVRAGVALPDISNAGAVRVAIGKAPKIGYSSGPSGDHLVNLCKDWRIADTKLVKAPPGVPVAKLLADGEVDLGFQQFSELLGMPGITIVGPLPPEVQATTTFVAGICGTSADVDAARDLIEFFANDDATAAKRRRGLEPG